MGFSCFVDIVIDVFVLYPSGGECAVLLEMVAGFADGLPSGNHRAVFLQEITLFAVLQPSGFPFSGKVQVIPFAVLLDPSGGHVAVLIKVIVFAVDVLPLFFDRLTVLIGVAPAPVIRIPAAPLLTDRAGRYRFPAKQQEFFLYVIYERLPEDDGCRYGQDTQYDQACFYFFHNRM